MQGFDLRFKNLPDYIYTITDEIWEQRGIHKIREWYSDDVIAHFPNFTSQGVDKIITGTQETLHAFPERRLLGEDVIWSGDDKEGFLSSHRIISTARHCGDGFFGKATGKTLYFRTIADCFCKGNKITEEWLVRDQAAIVLQLGYNLEGFAAETAGKPQHLASYEQLKAHHTPVYLQTHPAAKMVRNHMHGVWGEGANSLINENYHEAVNHHLPKHQNSYGKAMFDSFVMGYIAAFPDRKFFIDHSICLEEQGKPLRVATRWRLIATHSGRGSFGEPTQKPIVIMGITHSEIMNNLITREWHLIDELSLWQQIKA